MEIAWCYLTHPLHLLVRKMRETERNRMAGYWYVHTTSIPHETLWIWGLRWLSLSTWHNRQSPERGIAWIRLTVGCVCAGSASLLVNPDYCRQHHSLGRGLQNCIRVEKSSLGKQARMRIFSAFDCGHDATGCLNSCLDFLTMMTWDCKSYKPFPPQWLLFLFWSEYLIQ